MPTSLIRRQRTVLDLHAGQCTSHLVHGSKTEKPIPLANPVTSTCLTLLAGCPFLLSGHPRGQALLVFHLFRCCHHHRPTRDGGHMP